VASSEALPADQATQEQVDTEGQEHPEVLAKRARDFQVVQTVIMGVVVLEV